MIDKPSKGLDKWFLSWELLYFCDENLKNETIKNKYHEKVIYCHVDFCKLCNEIFRFPIRRPALHNHQFWTSLCKTWRTYQRSLGTRRAYHPWNSDSWRCRIHGDNNKRECFLHEPHHIRRLPSGIDNHWSMCFWKLSIDLAAHSCHFDFYRR